MKQLRTILLVAGALSLASAGSALAHHSGAMFNAAQTQRLTGEVTAIEWTNPHVWLSVRDTSARAGKPGVWHFELIGPAALGRLGFSRELFSPGTIVTVEHHPLRDGRPGGQLLTVTFADGRTMRATAERVPAAK